MTTLDDEITVVHKITCECGERFKKMDHWLTHKRHTEHKRKIHVFYAAIDGEIEVIRVIKRNI
jgi:hypothetical protein